VEHPNVSVPRDSAVAHEPCVSLIVKFFYFQGWNYCVPNLVQAFIDVGVLEAKVCLYLS